MSVNLIVGDPHIGGSLLLGKSGIGSALNSRIVDQITILDWILFQAIDHSALNIILTGDVFDDPRPHPTIIKLFFEWLKKCTDNNISVHIVAGNHDILRSGQFYMSALDIVSAADLDDVFVYKNISTLDTPGVSFTLMPFRDRRSFNLDSNAAALQVLQDKLPYQLAGIDRNNAKIVVGHFAIEGSIPVGNEINDMVNELFCPVSMFKGYDYTWMGHVHKPQILSKLPFVAHVGSMDLSDFSEANHTKVIVVFDSDKSDPYKYLEIPSRPLNQISISVPAEITDTTTFVINEIKEKYNNKLSKSVIKLNISTNSSDVVSVDRTAIEKCLSEAGSFHTYRINEERKIAPIKQNVSAEIDNTVNESTAIKMYAETNIDESTKNDFIALASQIVKDCSELK